MFIGHFAVGFAAKRGAKRASLGTYVAAALFLDILWPVSTAFTALDYVGYPWSHSLLMAVVWSLVFGGGHDLLRLGMWISIPATIASRSRCR